MFKGCIDLGGGWSPILGGSIVTGAPICGVRGFQFQSPFEFEGFRECNLSGGVFFSTIVAMLIKVSIVRGA